MTIKVVLAMVFVAGWLTSAVGFGWFVMRRQQVSQRSPTSSWERRSEMFALPAYRRPWMIFILGALIGVVSLIALALYERGGFLISM